MIIIKTQKEIDFIKESCRLVARTLDKVKEFVKIGIRTCELDIIAEDFIRSNGGLPAFKGYGQKGTIPYPNTLCTSIDFEVVHGIPNNRVLNEGEILSIDVGVLKNNYYGDGAISVGIGKISEEKFRLMEETEKSLYIGIENAREGNRIGDISFSIQNYVESKGYSVVRDLCGHGVGKHLHEDPQIPNYGNKNTGLKLKKGMTLAIEPMVNMGTHEVKVAKDGWTVCTIDKLPSAHFEHTILVNENKAEILTIS